jgi:hypothetical protein
MRADLRSTTRGMRPLLATWFVLLGLVLPAQGAGNASREQLVERAKARLLRDVQHLEQHLTRGGEDVVAGWKRYLDLDAIKAEMRQPEPSVARLTELWHHFFAAQEGLDRPQFLAVRDSVRHYCLLASTPKSDLQQQQADALAWLQQQIEAYRKSDSRDDAQHIGQTIAWLKATSSQDKLIKQVEQELGHPNSYIRVSSRLANYFLTREVSDRERVSANVAGAQTTGDAETKATLWLHTSPAQDFGAIDIRLTGKTTTSNSVSQRGNISIFGGAVTSIDARVRLNVREDVLSVDPPEVHAVTKSHINDIEANRRIIERIAWRRAPKEMPKAEAEAARQVEQRLSERLSQETAKLIEKANNLYANEIRKPMTRRGAWPKLKYFSDGKDLHVRLVQANPYQVAARNSPPHWPVTGDLTMTGHESMFENTFEGIFAGREIEDTKFLYLMELLTGESPRPLWVHEREPRWSTIMYDERPLRVRFRDQELLVTFAVKETRRGEDRLDMPALITARYTASATPEGPVFTRIGEVGVEFPDREKQSARAEELRTFLTRKFNAVMLADLHFDGLAAPAGGFGDKLNRLQIREVGFAGGWALLRYELNLAPATTTLVSAPSK